MTPQEEERLKYEKVWSNRDYAVQADGEPLVDLAYDIMECKPGEMLTDWGCGCGRPAAKFRVKGLRVMGVDIAHNCLDENLIGAFKLHVGCLWNIMIPKAHYAFCTDVLEHIPPTYVDDVLRNIRASTTKAAFIQVCVLPDIWGAKMDPPTVLHLTVQPGDWWEAQLHKHWKTVERIGVGGKARRAFLCR